MSRKPRGHLDLCAVNVRKLRSSHVFSVDSILGVKYDLILVVRSQFFEYMRETLHKYALKHLEAARLEKKSGKKVFFPTEAPD